MQREQILSELQCSFWPARAKLIIYAADSLLTFHVSSLHSQQTRVDSSIASLPLSIVVHILTRFWTPTDVFMLLHVCTFFTFSSHKFLHLFTFALPFFLLPFIRSFLFFKVLLLYPIFTRTLVIALNIFLLRASIDATIRLSLSVFIRPNPCATSGFLQLIYLLTPPEW